jgi:histidinol phosphatase-like PHP family hydrolase
MTVKYDGTVTVAEVEQIRFAAGIPELEERLQQQADEIHKLRTEVSQLTVTLGTLTEDLKPAIQLWKDLEAQQRNLKRLGIIVGSIAGAVATIAMLVTSYHAIVGKGP